MRSASTGWALALWREPRVHAGTRPGYRDALLVAALLACALIERSLRNDLTWPNASLALCALVVLTLAWRRTRPLMAVLLAFGGSLSLTALAWAHDVGEVGLHTSLCVLLLPYALFRWGSGRDIIAGSLLILATLCVALVAQPLPPAEAVAATVFLLLPASIGTALRYRQSAQERALAQARWRERNQLARELHDTVAHHVSIIALHAQAARAVADSATGQPLQSLEVIEQAASNALSDMRTLVHALRDDAEAELAPAPTLADIERLQRTDAAGIAVSCTLGEGAHALEAGLQGTLYRLAREAVTNAMRHARDVRHIRVHVGVDPTRALLRVVDDGACSLPGTPQRAGSGLRGMHERVGLLGGTLHAGPAAHGGWTVEATIPRIALSA